MPAKKPPSDGPATASLPSTVLPFLWAIRDDPKVTGMTFTVAALHASIADNNGDGIYQSQQKMAEKLGLADRGTIGRHQQILRDLGYLQLTGKRQRTNVHRLSLPVASPHVGRLPRLAA